MYVRKDRLWIIALGLFVVIERLTQWFYQEAYSISGQLDPSYLEALTNHFWEYLCWFHTKPVGSLLVDKLLLEVVGSGQIVRTRFFLVSALDGASVFFLFAIAIRCRINRLLAFLICVGWVGALNVFDFWRIGSHFDHFNVFLISAFSWSLLRYIQVHTIGWLAASTIGLLLFYAPAVALPVLLLPVFLLDRAPFRRRRLLSYFAAVGVALFVLVGKNGYNVGGYSTSTVSAQNRIQFSYFMFGTDRLKQRIESGNYPDWFKWCSAYAASSGPEDRAHVRLIYGMCNRDAKEHYDYDSLRTYLAHNPNPEILNAVDKDRLVLSTKPWLFAGGVPEMNSFFAMRLSQWSAKVWRDGLLEAPTLFFETLLKASGFFYLQGPKFFQGRNYEPGMLDSVVWSAPNAKVLLIGNAMAMVWVMLGSPLVMLRIFSRRALNPIILFVWTASFLLITIGMALNSMTCCENHRMYVSVAPLALIVAMTTIGLAWNRLLRWFV